MLFAHALLDYIGHPSFVLVEAAGPKLVYGKCNRLWADTLGSDAQAWVGKPVENHISDVSILTVRLAALPDGGRLTHEISANGKTHTLTVTAHRHPGQPAQYLAICTEPMTGHPTLDVASSLTEEMEQFISFAAHDLRTPMRNIESLAELLREGFVDMGDGKVQLIDMLEEVAVKAARLITDILSQAQAATPAQLAETFDLSELCEDIMCTLDPGQIHQLHVGATQIEADKTAVQIALRNLMDNALKHGDRDRILLSIHLTQQPDGMLQFDLHDTGNGFDDPSLAFLDGGELRIDSGYGLLGMRRLIEARGGTVGAGNLPGKTGGYVRFSLPGHLVPPIAMQGSGT